MSCKDYKASSSFAFTQMIEIWLAGEMQIGVGEHLLFLLRLYVLHLLSLRKTVISWTEVIDTEVTTYFSKPSVMEIQRQIPHLPSLKSCKHNWEMTGDILVWFLIPQNRIKYAWVTPLVWKLFL